MKKTSLMIVAVLLLALSLPRIAAAAPMYYSFEGTVKKMFIHTQTPYQIAIGDKLTFVYMADFEHQAWKLTNTGVVTWKDGKDLDFFETTRLTPRYVTDKYYPEYYEGAIEMHYGHEFLNPDEIYEITFASGSESLQTAIDIFHYRLATLSVGAIGIFVEEGYFRVDGHQVADRFEGDVVLTSISSRNPLELSPVPEPATMLLLGLGLAGAAVARRRFRK